MRALLVEHDKEDAEALETLLRNNGFMTHTADSGEEAVSLARRPSYHFDLIVADLKLPDMSVREALRNLRGGRINTPLIVLSKNTCVEYRVLILEGGADDFILKPVHPLELIARAHAVIRRDKGHSCSVIRTGPLSVDINSKTVKVKERPVHVTGMEYGILELLSIKKGRVITIPEFKEHLYDGLNDPAQHAVEVFISRLRRKLSNASRGDCFIETIRDRGYILRDHKKNIVTTLGRKAA